MSDERRIEPATLISRPRTPADKAETDRMLEAQRVALGAFLQREEEEARAAYKRGGNGRVYGGYVVHPDHRGARRSKRRRSR